jgi:N-acetylglucosamine kinase-like BadF-type ATPase
VGGVTAAVLAIDGGNSKTDVCLLSADGQLLGYARGHGSNHQIVGLDTAFDVLAGLVAEARVEAGIDAGSTLAQLAAVYLAGADFPREIEMLLARVSLAGWAAEVSLDNDTFALLRAGTDAAQRDRRGLRRGYQLCWNLRSR